MAADDYAVLVGITKYSSRLGSLQAPESDAQRFRDWLVETSGGAVPPANIKLIVTSMYPSDPKVIGEARPNSLDLKAALAEISETPRRRDGKIGRRFYLYLSGHGFEPLLGEHTAVYSACAVPPALDDNFPALDQALAIWRSAAFEEVVLILDCCRTTLPQHPVNTPSYSFGPDAESASLGRLYLAFAIGPGDSAKEGPIPGAPAQTGVSGYFTWALVNALQCAKGNALGQVTGEQLRNTLLQIWQPLQSRFDLPAPELRWQGGGDLIWVERSVAPLTAVRFSVPGAQDGTILSLYEGKPPRIFQTLKLINEKAETSLVEGIYKVIREDLGAGSKKLFEIPGDRDVNL